MPADNLIVALPSKGNLAEPCEGFFARAGLRIYKPNRRQYSATIPRLPQAEVVYQRPLDILNKVLEGRAGICVPGLGIVAEHGGNLADVVGFGRLGFFRFPLPLAVPHPLV